MISKFNDQFVAENYFFFIADVWERYHEKKIGPERREKELKEIRERLLEIKAKGVIPIPLVPTVKLPNRRDLHNVYAEFMELIEHGESVQDISGIPR